ncbi:MAG TPA: hypothetical protein VNO22_10275 [Planctomycetota bacterium]|nr:hypothetical protein [Planctomycetota bacterium]
MDHRAVEYLELSGGIDTAKRLIARNLDKLDLDELDDAKKARLKNAVLTRFLERFKEGAAKIVESTFPSNVLDEALKILKSEVGRNMTFYNVMAESRLADLAEKEIKKVIEELEKEEDEEERKRKQEERKDRGSKGKK